MAARKDSSLSLIEFARQGGPIVNTSERFPDGCDWHKPPGCTCRLKRQADACYEGCGLPDRGFNYPAHTPSITREERNVIIALIMGITIVIAAIGIFL